MIPVDQARAIERAVTSISGVDSLHPGRFGEVALLYPGERVRGLKVNCDRLEVHLTVSASLLTSTLDVLADQVRVTAQDFTDLTVDVHINDIR